MITVKLPFNSCQLKDGILIPLNYLAEAGLWYLGYFLVTIWIGGQETFGWLFWTVFLLFIRGALGASVYDGSIEEEEKAMKRYNIHYYYPFLLIKRIVATIDYLMTRIPISVEYKYAD